MICGLDISMEKNRTFLPSAAAESDILLARDVLPTEGLAATMISSPSWRPSRSLFNFFIPVVMPLIVPFLL